MQIFSLILGFTHLKLPFNEVKFMILKKFNFTFYLRYRKFLHHSDRYFSVNKNNNALRKNTEYS